MLTPLSFKETPFNRSGFCEPLFKKVNEKTSVIANDYLLNLTTENNFLLFTHYLTVNHSHEGH